MSAPRSSTLIAGLAATLPLAAASVAMLSAQQSAPAYKDAKRPVAERVADLLSRMTLEEKVAQMQGIWRPKIKIQDEAGRFDPAHAAEVLGQGLGEFSRPSEIASTPDGPRLRTARDEAEFVNAVQTWVIEHTRLGIPVMFHEEALHGFVALHATSFPVPIALASSWDPPLVERVMSAAAYGSARPRLPARAGAGRRSRPRPPLGTIRGDVRRRSVSRRPHWHRRDSRLPGHQRAARSAQRARDAQALRRPRLE